MYCCTHWLRPRNLPPPSPRICAHIRGRYSSAKIDDITFNPLRQSKDAARYFTCSNYFAALRGRGGGSQHPVISSEKPGTRRNCYRKHPTAPPCILAPAHPPCQLIQAECLPTLPLSHTLFTPCVAGRRDA